MWQRGGGNNRQPAISNPYQFRELDHEDQYYDERYLETIHEVDSISSRRQSAHIGLPELPFRTVPPMADIPQPTNVRARLPAAPTASTAPAAPPKDRGLRVNVNVETQAQTAEISPLTPRGSHDRVGEEQPVSPIEPAQPVEPRAPLPEKSYQSQLPRKVSKPQTGDKSLTKWDEYSGEPTNDDRGKPASVRPGSQPVEMQYPHLKERTKQILAGLRERDSAKKQPWGKQPPPVAADPLDDPPQREPWRGASGRVAIVEPVKNTPQARKLPIPSQFPERITSRKPVQQAVVTQPQQREASPRRKPLRASPSEESIKPVVPLKTRNLTPDLTKNSPIHSPTSEQSPVSTAISPEPALLPSATFASERMHQRVESPHDISEPTTPTTPTTARETISDKLSDTPPTYTQPEMGREQSRFSWTTYTTSVADSPQSSAQIAQDSSPPPMPNLPPAMVIKKRPVSTNSFVQAQPFYMQPHYVDSRGSVVRKPLPGVGSRNASSTTVTSRAMSTSKTLPLTPTIMEAADRVENLEAQIDSLRSRRQNSTRIILDLENTLKKNAVEYNMWQRREVEKNIANQKSSLDEIGREIHDLGLQLHRAQKKRDSGEGSALWIKRVTS